jgi:ribosome-associated translation inhibitor RaiA
VFRASGDLVMPHKNLHAEEENEDAYVAIDAVKHKLQIEIEKYKQD